MSLESFDKFCEKMILGEPGSEKEVFDERQNQIRAKLTTEALWVCLYLSALLVLSNELFAWCGGMFVLILLAGAIGYLWWVIRNAVKGSLFGVKGTGTFWTAVIMVFESFYCLLMLWGEDGAFPLTEQGQVSGNLLALIIAVVLMVSSIVVFVLTAKRKKQSSTE